MAELRDLLCELGTEELPPKALTELAAALEVGVVAGLERAGITHGAVSRYCAPRRLALWIRDLADRQPDRQQSRRGPALEAAYRDGQPTPALLGFARSCGVEPDALTVEESDKGSWITHVSTLPGACTTALIPGILRQALEELPIPRRMRWGAGEAEFVRPVHWLVLLFGEDVVDAELLGVRAGRATRGHRFHHPLPIELERPEQYAERLENPGRVIADFARRRTIIRQQADAAAANSGGIAVIDDALLDEVTALVEWPVPMVGGFERRFLNVPAEALISTMQDNQKYFPIVDQQGRLLPSFIFVSNLESHDPEQVRRGNERVIRPRFADAEFFWQQDRKLPLAERLEALKQVVFQQKLGNLHDKIERVAALARHIAPATGANPDWAERAGRLSKCDLLTSMVQEFPELQGIMGRYYAGHDGEATEVAQALEEQYWPRFAGDRLPATATGQAVALADRIDTLLGIFAIGQPPTGARDPFGLRRAALGVLRITIECGIDLDLDETLRHAARHLPASVHASDAVVPVRDFVMDRLRGYYLDQGFRVDEFDAVLECLPARPLDFDRRIRAVAVFRRLPEAASLAAANKRIRNILRKAETESSDQVDPALLTEAAERKLAAKLVALSSEALPLMNSGLYEEALLRLAALREPVDAFFDQVMVMADDAALRANRLALLNELASLFLRAADFSRLQD